MALAEQKKKAEAEAERKVQEQKVAEEKMTAQLIEDAIGGTPAENKEFLAIIQAEKQAEEDLKNEEKAEKEKVDFRVLQAPSFKILLGKYKTAENVTPDFSHLSLLVYHSEIGYDTYYFAGNYISVTQAVLKLAELKKDPQNEGYKVIGLYRGNPISLDMAADLGIQYRRQRKK